jgi:hypothetical protein
MTADGKTDVYIHGEPWDTGSSIELVYDPELIKAANLFLLPIHIRKMVY